MRRVARLQPRHLPAAERAPVHGDGSVNLAHLLVGSEARSPVYKRLKLQLAPLPRAKVLGVVNFPTFRRRWRRRSTW
jgi:hypothetical protein